MGIGWWKEYLLLRRKYELDSEVGYVHQWKGDDKGEIYVIGR